MSSDVDITRSATSGIRIVLGLGGLIALVVGILILVWPGHTAAAVTAIIAVYAIVAGLVYVGIAIFSRTRGAWSRVGHAVLALLFIAAGVIAFSNLAATTVAVATFVAIFLGITWLVEGVVALTTLGDAASKEWTTFFAIVSIAAGLALVFSPAYIAVVWLFVGISLIVQGAVQIVRAFRFGAQRA